MLSDLAEPAEDQADDLAVDQGGAAAVAGVDRGVDLDPHARGLVAVGGELDPRDDPLGDRQARAPLGVAVDQDGVLDLGQLVVRGRGGRLSKNDSSSSFRTARSMPGLTASTVADQLVARLRATRRRAGWRRCTTWALVRIRLPSITTPVPLASRGLCLAQGRIRSGIRIVAEIFTTDSRIAVSCAWASAALLSRAGGGRARPPTRPRGRPRPAQGRRQHERRPPQKGVRRNRNRSSIDHRHGPSVRSVSWVRVCRSVPAGRTLRPCGLGGAGRADSS